MQIRVYYEDTDAQGVVYHANYLKFCERARSEIFFQEEDEIFTKESYFVVTNINANFKKPAILGDIIEVRTKLKDFKNASLTLSQEIYRLKSLKNGDKDEFLFDAQIKVAFLKNGKPSKIPQSLKELFKSVDRIVE